MGIRTRQIISVRLRFAPARGASPVPPRRYTRLLTHHKGSGHQIAQTAAACQKQDGIDDERQGKPQRQIAHEAPPQGCPRQRAPVHDSQAQKGFADAAPTNRVVQQPQPKRNVEQRAVFPVGYKRENQYIRKQKKDYVDQHRKETAQPHAAARGAEEKIAVCAAETVSGASSAAKRPPRKSSATDTSK